MVQIWVIIILSELNSSAQSRLSLQKKNQRVYTSLPYHPTKWEAQTMDIARHYLCLFWNILSMEPTKVQRWVSCRLLLGDRRTPLAYDALSYAAGYLIFYIFMMLVYYVMKFDVYCECWSCLPSSIKRSLDAEDISAADRCFGTVACNLTVVLSRNKVRPLNFHNFL